MVYYVYVLECEGDKSLYIGFTRDLRQRYKDHREGKGGSATKRKHDRRLIYFEGYSDKADAIGREKFLKSGSGRRYIRKQLFHYFEKGHE